MVLGSVCNALVRMAASLTNDTVIPLYNMYGSLCVVHTCFMSDYYACIHNSVYLSICMLVYVYACMCVSVCLLVALRIN